MKQNASLGYYIHKFRSENGLTQSQLAEMINVTPQAISKWEKGGTPDALLLPSIAEALNVTINDLFGMPGKTFIDRNSLYNIISSFVQQIPAEEQISAIIGIAYIALIATSDNELIRNIFSQVHSLETFPYYDQILKLQSNFGFAIGNIIPDTQFVFISKPFITENDKQIIDEFSTFFRILSDCNSFLVLNYFLNQKENISVNSELLANELSMTQEEAEHTCRMLESANILRRKEVKTAKKLYTTWYIYNNIPVQALLTIARTIIYKQDKLFSINLDNTKDYSLFKQ